jgi:hypothetical protein
MGGVFHNAEDVQIFGYGNAGRFVEKVCWLEPDAIRSRESSSQLLALLTQTK